MFSSPFRGLFISTKSVPGICIKASVFVPFPGSLYFYELGRQGTLTGMSSRPLFGGSLFLQISIKHMLDVSRTRPLSRGSLFLLKLEQEETRMTARYSSPFRGLFISTNVTFTKAGQNTSSRPLSGVSLFLQES